MIKHFPHQSGEFSFLAKIETPTTANGISFGFGCSGIDQKISFSGISGQVFDQNGYFIGSYGKGRQINISGTVFDSYWNYYINGHLTRTNIPITGYASNYFFFESDSPDVKSKVSYSIAGDGSIADKTVLYLTDDRSREESIIELFEGVFSDLTVSGSADSFSCSQLEDVSAFDMVVFGAEITGEYDPDTWGAMKNPIFSMNKEVSRDLGWIHGGLFTIYSNTGIDYQGRYQSSLFPNNVYSETGMVIMNTGSHESSRIVESEFFTGNPIGSGAIGSTFVVGPFGPIAFHQVINDDPTQAGPRALFQIPTYASFTGDYGDKFTEQSKKVIIDSASELSQTSFLSVSFC